MNWKKKPCEACGEMFQPAGGRDRRCSDCRPARTPAKRRDTNKKKAAAKTATEFFMEHQNYPTIGEALKEDERWIVTVLGAGFREYSRLFESYVMTRKIEDKKAVALLQKAVTVMGRLVSK